MSFIGDLTDRNAEPRTGDGSLPKTLTLFLLALGYSLSSFELVTIFVDRTIGQSYYLIGLVFLVVITVIAVHFISKKEDTKSPEEKPFYQYTQSERKVAKISLALIILSFVGMCTSFVNHHQPLPKLLEGIVSCNPEGQIAGLKVEALDKDKMPLPGAGTFMTDSRGYFNIVLTQSVRRNAYLRFVAPDGTTYTESLNQYLDPEDNETTIFHLDYCP